MSRIARTVLIVAVALTAGGAVALAITSSSAAQTVNAGGAAVVATPSTVAPTTTTTAPPAPTTAAPRPVVTEPRPVAVTAPRPVVTTAPVVRPPSGKVESCGWGWDAFRIDDGSLNEVTIMLDAPRRPNEAVTFTLKPGGSNTSTPAMSHGTRTDENGQASSTFSLSNDKRDWSVTISAVFASGSTCSAQSFTIVY